MRTYQQKGTCCRCLKSSRPAGARGMAIAMADDDRRQQLSTTRVTQQDDEGYRRCDGASAIAALKPSLSLGWKTTIVGKSLFVVAVRMCQCSHFHNNELPVLMRRDTRPHHSSLTTFNNSSSPLAFTTCIVQFLLPPFTLDR